MMTWEKHQACIPFLDVVRNRSTQITKEYLEKVYNELDGKFAGFGEFALYRDELAGTDLAGEPWATIYEFAAEKDLFVMIHIGLSPSDLASLEAAMASHPNTKFLVHGFELGGEGYVRLLKTYLNFYFTLDTATLLKDATPGQGLHLMYPQGTSGVSEFLTGYEQNKQRLLEQAREEWVQVVLAAPNRVMWGTDVSFDWHTDQEVYSRQIEFSNEFIDSLPADVQDRFTYQNAVTLLGDEGFVYESPDDEEK